MKYSTHYTQHVSTPAIFFARKMEAAAIVFLEMPLLLSRTKVARDRMKSIVLGLVICRFICVVHLQDKVTRNAFDEGIVAWRVISKQILLRL
jgi:hypothetical protein